MPCLGATLRERGSRRLRPGSLPQRTPASLAARSKHGVVAGEIMALLPHPPTAPRRGHQFVESRKERLVRWRFDCMIAATALVSGLTLIHNNAGDFESIRKAIEISPERFPSLGPLGLIRCTSLT